MALAGVAVVAVDNTFASPYFQRCSLGADSRPLDNQVHGRPLRLIGGAVVTSKPDYEGMKFYRTPLVACRAVRLLGRAPRPENSGHPYAPARASPSRSSSRTTLRWRWLAPGLPSHPQHELAKRQMSGFSGMVSLLEGRRGGCLRGNAEDGGDPLRREPRGWSP